MPLFSSAPVSVINPSPQVVKLVQRVFTYAQLVTIGTTPQQIIGASAGKIIYPLTLMMETTRTNVTAGTSVPFQLRYNGVAVSLMAANVSSTFANGPGATLLQFNGITSIFSTAGSFAAGINFRNTAVMLVPTAAHLATGCVGSLSITISYIEFPI
jgi:hypothetical protein